MGKVLLVAINDKPPIAEFNRRTVVFAPHVIDAHVLLAQATG
jgi:hypothetical protein